MRPYLCVFVYVALFFSFASSVLAEDDPTFLNTVFLIRNGEMNTDKVGSGLNATGEARAQCLPSVSSRATQLLHKADSYKVFGQGTNRTVGYIIAEPPMKSGEGTEAIDTITPLANTLGIKIDTSWYEHIAGVPIM